MAKKETFLLVSLEEEKARKLAQVISNDTCRKILDSLAAKKATETELSKKLSIPLSTVHYNLKHLLKSRLVEAEEFHYSEKGKEVLHYSLANKYVIIAPQGMSDKIKDRLKSIIGAVIGAGFIGLAVQYLPNLFGAAKVGAAESLKGAPIAEQVSREAMDMAAMPPPMPSVQPPATEPIWLWIVIGAVLCILLYLLFEYIRKRKKK